MTDEKLDLIQVAKKKKDTAEEILNYAKSPFFSIGGLSESVLIPEDFTEIREAIAKAIEPLRDKYAQEYAEI